MKILCVSAQAMFPETRFGGAKRLYYLTKALEARAEVDVIHIDGSGEIRSPGAFAPNFRRQLFLPRESASIFEQARVMANASKAIEKHRDAIAAFIGDARYDATVMFYAESLYFVARDLIPHPGRVVYLEDDLYLERLKEGFRSSPGLARRLLKRARFEQTRRFYRKTLRKIDAVVCISSQEAGIVRSEWRMPAHLIGYGIPLADYPLLPPPGRANVLGFIGNYRHWPNLDAARWLASTLLPAVQARIPDARLVLAGVGLPGELRAALAKNPAVEILDEVKDLAEFYGPISVFVNAVREGRGLRTKVVEAAAYGRPVLSTRLGAEGLESLDIGLFETAEEFARGVAALADSGNAARVARSNRAEVEARFSLDAVGATLLGILSPPAPARLACILLNYRNPEDTLACLAALARGPADGAKIFLVNNYPEDGSGAALRAGLDALGERGFGHAYIEPGSNTGFAGGCNVGLRAALAEDFTHFVVLNNDTLPDPDFLAEVRRHAEAHPEAVLAGRVLEAGTNEVSHNIGRISPVTGRVAHIFDADYRGEIDFVSGCLMVVPRAALETAGLFDERLFMYCEDTDLCLRLKRAGVPVLYRPSIRIAHKSSSSARVSRLPKGYYVLRNQILVTLKNGSPLQVAAGLGIAALTPAWHAVRRPGLFLQSLRGLRDGLLGRSGRRHAD